MGTIYVCDKCKKQEAAMPRTGYSSPKEPKDWSRIDINMQIPGGHMQFLLLCKECLVTAGLGAIDKDRLISTNPTAEALYDAIVDIVQGEIEAYEP